MAGSFIIILTALLFKRLRTHPYSLVMWLSICDFFFSMKYVGAAIYPNSFSLNLNRTYCQVSGLYTNFFALASVSWSAVLSFNLILNTVRPFGDTSHYTVYFHLFVWTVSGVSTLLVGLSRDIGISADGTCWFEVSEKFHWQFFVPLIVYFLLALSATLFSTWRTWNFSHGATRYAVKLIVRMTLYVAVFLASWLGPTVHELIVTVHGIKSRHAPQAPPLAPFAPISHPTSPSIPITLNIPQSMPSTMAASDAINWGLSLLGQMAASPITPLAPVISSPEGFNTNSPLTWWTGCSVALVGFFNALIWLSNPSIYKLIKHRLVLRYCSCWYNRAERIPLITKLEQIILEDQDSDVHQLNIVFRNNALACLLLGIRFSISQISKTTDEALSGSLKLNEALKRAGRPEKDLGPKKPKLDAPLPSPIAHIGLESHAGDKSSISTSKDKEGKEKLDNGTDSELIPLEDDDITTPVTHGWAVRSKTAAVKAIRAEEIDTTRNAQNRITDVFDGPQPGYSKPNHSSIYQGEPTSLADAMPPRTRGFASRAGSIEPATINGFTPDNSLHVLTNLDFDHVAEMDLSPENLEELDVPDLFTSPFLFCDFAPHVFHNIRVRFGFPSLEYYSSLEPGPFMTAVLENAEFSSGRSGSFMCYSPNRRFLIKTIPDHEAATMRRILPAYYAHIEHNPNTLLSPIIGLYTLRLVGAPSLNIIVMANLFSHELLTPSIVYDLKGSWEDRGGQTVKGIRKDNDLKSPFQMTYADATSIYKQLEADSAMLASQGVMDYSLLVGVRDTDTSRATNSYVPPRQKRGRPTRNSSSNNTTKRNTSASIATVNSSKPPSAKAAPKLERHSEPPAFGSLSGRECESMRVIHSARSESEDEDLYIQEEDAEKTHAVEKIAAVVNANPDELPRFSLESTDDDITFEHSKTLTIDLYGKDGPNKVRTTCARVASSPDNQQLYVVGIIDILQSYNFSKRVERFFKVYFRCKSKTGLSATNPIVYQDRFRKAMAHNVGYQLDPDELA